MLEPYYKNDYVTLYCGDCLEIMSQLDITFDCCITDPPYGTTACKWDNVIPFEPMWKELNRLVKPNGAICLFGSEPFSSYLRMSNIENFKYDWVWDKQTGLGFLDSKFRPLKSHEIISVFSKGGCSNGSKSAMVYNPQGLIPTTKKNTHGKNRLLHSQADKEFETTHTNYPKTILNFARVSGFHPTQKPINLIEYLVQTYSLEQETVLDFTAGSCTTGVACMNLKRKCVLIEKNLEYCKKAVERMERIEEQLELF